MEGLLYCKPHFEQLFKGIINANNFSLYLYRMSSSWHYSGIMAKETCLQIGLIFDLFDVNRSGHIDFTEFVRSLGVFHPKAPQADKILYAFKLYDLRQTGFIEREELKEMVSALLKESDLSLSDDIIESMVDKRHIKVSKLCDEQPSRGVPHNRLRNMMYNLFRRMKELMDF
ncbi:hypothetical protein LXL04_022496 [Taraxacum kok-saghyz]